MADSRIASFTKIHIFPKFFPVCTCGAIIALLSCETYLTCHEKLRKMPFWPILLPAAATSVFSTPKRLISYTSSAPSGSTGGSFGRTFGRSIPSCARLHPFRVYERVQIPDITLPIAVTHQLIVQTNTQSIAEYPGPAECAERLNNQREGPAPEHRM